MPDPLHESISPHAQEGIAEGPACPEQSAYLGWGEAFGIAPQQGYDLLPHGASGICGRSCWAWRWVRAWLWPRQWGSARHIKQTVIPLLRLFHHTQQECFTLTSGLSLFARLAFTLQCRLLAHLGCLKLLAQQIALQTQHVAFLLHGMK